VHRTVVVIFGFGDIEHVKRPDLLDIADIPTSDLVEPGTGECTDPGYPSSIGFVFVARGQQDVAGLLIGIATALALTPRLTPRK
jgi:hypothetical protein